MPGRLITEAPAPTELQGRIKFLPTRHQILAAHPATDIRSLLEPYEDVVLSHPVVMLSPACAADGTVLAFQISSLNGRPPAEIPRNSWRFLLPIHPGDPHPGSRICLHVLGDRELRKLSYVKIEKLLFLPLSVLKEYTGADGGQKLRLTEDSFRSMIRVACKRYGHARLEPWQDGEQHPYFAQPPQPRLALEQRPAPERQPLVNAGRRDYQPNAGEYRSAPPQTAPNYGGTMQHPGPSNSPYTQPHQLFVPPSPVVGLAASMHLPPEWNPPRQSMLSRTAGWLWRGFIRTVKTLCKWGTSRETVEAGRFVFLRIALPYAGVRLVYLGIVRVCGWIVMVSHAVVGVAASAIDNLKELWAGLWLG